MKRFILPCAYVFFLGIFLTVFLYLFQQKANFFGNARGSFLVLALGGSVIFVLGIFSVFRHRRPVGRTQAHSIFDMTSGFFGAEAFSLLARHELERAKRLAFGLTVVAVQIDPLEQIKSDLGDESVKRLISAMVCRLRAFIRCYDCCFRYRENIFVLLFSDTDVRAAQNIVARVRSGLLAQSFLVDNRQTEIIPRVRVGVANFPQDASELNVLVQEALLGLSVEKREEKPEEYITLVEGNLHQQMTDVLPVGFWDPAQNMKATSLLGTCDVYPSEEEEQEITEKTRRLKSLSDQEVKLPELDFAVEEEKEMEEAEENSIAAFKTLEYELAALNMSMEEVPELGKKEEKIADLHVPDVVLALTQGQEVLPSSLDPECGEISEITGITDIKVLQGEGDEDVIMVNFERERFDLASKFRRHQKQRRARGMRT